MSRRADEWTVDDVCAWLRELQMSSLEEKIKKEEIDGEALLLLEESDLRNMGMSLGPLKKLSSRIAKLREGLGTDSPGVSRAPPQSPAIPIPLPSSSSQSLSESSSLSSPAGSGPLLNPLTAGNPSSNAQPRITSDGTRPEQSTAMITINAKAIIQSVDLNCCQIFGYAAEELVGQKVDILIPRPYREQHDSYIQRYQQTGVKRIIGQTRMVEGLQKSGTVFPCHLNISEITTDIGEQLFIAMIDPVEEEVAVITITKKGDIISCNKTCQKLFGYTATELLGKNIKLLMPPSYAKYHDMYLAAYKGSENSPIIGRVRNLPGVHKSGIVFPICLQVKEITAGNSLLFRGQIQAVAETESIFTVTYEGVIVACNKHFVLPMFGYRDYELIGCHIHKLLPSFDTSDESVNRYKSSSSGEASARVDTEGESSSLSSTLRIPVHEANHKDKSTFPVCLELAPFVSPDGERLLSLIIKRAKRHSSSPLESAFDMVGDYRISDFIVLKKSLGKGSFGIVQLGQNVKTLESVAVKILPVKNKDDPDFAIYERSRREVSIMKDIDHPYICKLFDIAEQDGQLFIFMEYLSGGDLFSLIARHKWLSERLVKKFLYQLAIAVKYLHSKCIVHRDIKDTNILLDASGDVKLIDFGLSSMTNAALRSSFCGTREFAAPEMILRVKYNGPETDIWSLGVVLYVMATGYLPFGTVIDSVHGNYEDPVLLSPECRDLIRRMLCVDVTKRYTIDEILAHPFLRAEQSQEELQI